MAACETWAVVTVAVGVLLTVLGIAFCIYACLRAKGRCRWRSSLVLPMYTKQPVNQEQYNQKIEDLTKTIEYMCKEITSLKDKLNQKEATYAKLVKATGKELSAEIGRDETKTENISLKCRPSVIQEEYSTLSFQTASNLKKVLPKPTNVPKATWTRFVNRLVCSFFVTSSEDIRMRFLRTMEIILNLLQEPLRKTSDVSSVMLTLSNDKDKQRITSVESVHATVIEYFRANNMDFTTDALVEDIVEKTLTRVGDDFVGSEHSDYVDMACTSVRNAMQQSSSNGGVNPWRTFIKQICQLSWHMTIQRPPMEFITPGIGEIIDESAQHVIPTPGLSLLSMDQLLVDYYMEPAMVHGEKVLVKGRVIPKT